MSQRKDRLRSDFTLGSEQAEADPLLDDAFFETGDYEAIASRDDPRCFLIGRTGAGKSAALQRLEEVAPDHVIRVNPEDLSLPYITDLHVVRHLDQLEINLDPLWIALWKHVLVVEVIRHRYNVDSPEAKQTMMTALIERVRRDPAKRAALEYLEEFDGRFWCETDERVREITDTFAKRMMETAGAGTGLGPLRGDVQGTSQYDESHVTRTEEIERYQRIVNETQLARLNKMVAVLREDILDSPQHFTYIVIDDLDRDWVDERLANDLIRCLFRTVLEMKRVRNLKVMVALRTNIFQELDFTRRGGGQEEKFRSMILQMSWTRDQLRHLLNERVRVASHRRGLTFSSYSELLPNSNSRRGNPMDYILDRTLLRPRDAIAFANATISEAAGKSRLSWTDIQNAERSYSTNRLLALRDEWKETYPGVELVLEVFRESPTRMDMADLFDRLTRVAYLLTDKDFPGVKWLTDAAQGLWTGSDVDSPYETYGALTQLLYAFGFLGCSGPKAKAPTFYSDSPNLMENESSFGACQYFFVHRTYHLALGILPTGRQVV